MYMYSWSQFAITVVKLWTYRWRKGTHPPTRHGGEGNDLKWRQHFGVAMCILAWESHHNEYNPNLKYVLFFIILHTHYTFITLSAELWQYGRDVKGRAQMLLPSSSWSSSCSVFVKVVIFVVVVAVVQILFATIINYTVGIHNILLLSFRLWRTHTHPHKSISSGIHFVFVYVVALMVLEILVVGFRLLSFIGAWIAIVLMEHYK